MALSIMPRQEQKKQNGILGTLGTLASLAGTFTGQPWLTTLGMGMSGLNGVLNGGGIGSAAEAAAKTAGNDDLEGLLKKLKDGWKNPASGNVAKSAEEQAKEEIARRFGNTAQSIATAANSVGAVQPVTTNNWPRPYDYGMFGYTLPSYYNWRT